MKLELFYKYEILLDDIDLEIQILEKTQIKSHLGLIIFGKILNELRIDRKKTNIACQNILRTAQNLFFFKMMLRCIITLEKWINQFDLHHVNLGVSNNRTNIYIRMIPAILKEAQIGEVFNVKNANFI